MADDRLRARPRRLPRREGLALRALAPNAVTVAAMCCGLTGIRFGLDGEWMRAVAAIILAGVLDGIDGRIARLMRAQSRFGAELDSLSDAIAFGVAPAMLLFLWSLHDIPRFGWIIALALAVACALRLARFNSRIDLEEQPHKRAGFLTGVPAPAGAGLAFLPVYLWFATGEPVFREPWLVAPWAALIALLMISSIATLSWQAIRPAASLRVPMIFAFGLVAASLLVAPWITLIAVCLAYIGALPVGMIRYRRLTRPGTEAAAPGGDG